jgi:hypothetical protein
LAFRCAASQQSEKFVNFLESKGLGPWVSVKVAVEVSFGLEVNPFVVVLKLMEVLMNNLNIIVAMICVWCEVALLRIFLPGGNFNPARDW